MCRRVVRDRRDRHLREIARSVVVQAAVGGNDGVTAVVVGHRDQLPVRVILVVRHRLGRLLVDQAVDIVLVRIPA